MKLDEVYALIWRRRLQRLLRARVPTALLFLLLALATGSVTHVVLSGMAGMLSVLPFEVRLGMAFKGMIITSAVPIVFGYVLAARSTDGNNESAMVLPISKAAWAYIINKSLFALLVPLIIGTGTAFAIVINKKMMIGSSGFWSLIACLCVFSSTMFVFAYRLSLLRFCVDSIPKKQLITWGGVAAIAAIGYALIRYGQLTIHQDEVILASRALFTWGLGIGSIVAVSFTIDRLMRQFDREVPQYVGSRRSRRTMSFRYAMSMRKMNVGAVVVAGLCRNAQSWVVYAAIVLGTIAVILYGHRSQNANFMSFVIGSLPLLLTMGCMSLLTGLRATLGASRNSVYVLPISISKVTRSVLAVGWTIVALTICGVSYMAARLLQGDTSWAALGRLMLLSALTTVLACLISITFFESRKDMTKGLGSSLATFLAASPLLMIDGWMKEKSLFLHGSVVMAVVTVVVVIMFALERRLTVKEYA